MNNLSEKDLKQSQTWLASYEEAIKRKTQSCFLLSDPSRYKIMLVLHKNKSLFVSDISDIVGISISAVSHQLEKLLKLGAVKSQKMGQNVKYSINSQSEIARCLVNIKRSNK